MGGEFRGFSEPGLACEGALPCHLGAARDPGSHEARSRQQGCGQPGGQAVGGGDHPMAEMVRMASTAKWVIRSIIQGPTAMSTRTAASSLGM